MSDTTAQITLSGLLSRRSHPVQLGLMAGMLAALVTLFIPNQYKSEARILPADQRSSGGLGAAAAAAAAVGVSIWRPDSISRFVLGTSGLNVPVT